MLRLVPEWTKDYEEFWEAIKRRNLLFIKLRYIAVLMLITFNYSGEIINIKLSNIQHSVIEVTTAVILLYNLLFHFIRPKLKSESGKFNPLHLSLLQIMCDLTALTLLVYFTGGVESPLLIFYVFHMIIGSLILPTYIIYTIATLSVLVIAVISFLQFHDLLPAHPVTGLYLHQEYRHLPFVIVFLVDFTFLILVSVFLANKIAHQLYKREKQLVETLEKLNVAENRKQKYIMGIVHEIKSPIAASKSILEIIEKGYLGEISSQVKEKIERAKIRTGEALEMINTILRISRMRLLNQKSFGVVNIRDILTKVIEGHSDVAKLKNVNIKLIEKGKKKENVEGDESLLELVFSNIIGNALKYSETNGNIELTVRYGKNALEVQICDDGIGIPKGELEKIFDSYYRSDNIKKLQSEGSGLGLSLVKEIVEQHNGNIKAKSPSPLGNKERPGTCFKIKLPYAAGKFRMEKEPRLTIKGGV